MKPSITKITIILVIIFGVIGQAHGVRIKDIADIKGVRTFGTHPRRLPDLFKGGQLVLLGRYRQGVPREDIAFIQAYAGRQMRDFDYELEPLNFTLGQRLRFNLTTRPKGLFSMAAWLGLEQAQQRFPGLVGRTPKPRMRLPRQQQETGLNQPAGAPTSSTE